MCLFAFIFERRTNFCIGELLKMEWIGIQHVLNAFCFYQLNMKILKTKINNSNSKKRISAKINACQSCRDCIGNNFVSQRHYCKTTEEIVEMNIFDDECVLCTLFKCRYILLPLFYKTRYKSEIKRENVVTIVSRQLMNL